MRTIARGWRFLVDTEPVVLSAVIAALFYVMAEFGSPLTDGQTHAVQGLAFALLAWFARARSTSDRTLEDAGTSRTKVEEVACVHGLSLVPRWDATELRTMYPEQGRRDD